MSDYTPKNPFTPDHELAQQLPQLGSFNEHDWNAAVDSLKIWAERAGLNPDTINLQEALVYSLFDNQDTVTDVNAGTGKALAGAGLGELEAVFKETHQ